MKRSINYGKHAVNGTRRINEIVIDVCIEPSEYYNPKTKEHYTNGEHFSVSGEIWNGTHTDIIQGGQCIDEIIPKYARDETSRNLLKLWRVFHLSQMDAIPERFRDTLSRFVSGTDDTLTFEHKPCAAYLLKVNEKVADYGTFTDGEIIVKTPDGMTETIHLSQGDEIKSPIVKRAWNAINRLYIDVPSEEDIARTERRETNLQEYNTKREKKRNEDIRAIIDTAERIIETVKNGNAPEDASMGLCLLKRAEKCFKTEDKKYECCEEM